MAASSLSTIAQLLCYQSLPVNFAKLIGEVDSLLDQDLHGPFKVSWDCDSAACFDQSGTRVLLAWNEYPGQGLSGVLTVSVGPSPLAGKPCMRPDHEALAMRLADHLAQRVQSAQTLWHRMACHMSPEWADLLIDALPPDLPLVEPAEPLAVAAGSNVVPLARPTPGDVLPVLARRAPVQTTHHPAERNPPMDPELIRLRAALYEDDDVERPSVQMRLAVHAMNATLIMVWMPLGAAALVHGMVRGEDMRVASRLMVLTGSVGALMQTPIGQNLATLAWL